MPQIAANGIEIEYEIGGAGPPLLLIMGLGGQLTDWPADFVSRLEQHFTVIRFDNRDAGLSTIIDGPAPTRWQTTRASLFRSAPDAPYALDDMADDSHALVRALGFSSVHVVGMSMGAMIAQLVAIRHPQVVRTLTSIMSNTASRSEGLPTARVMRILATRGQPSRDEALDALLELFSEIGGADWDRQAQIARSTASIARSYQSAGVLRQSLAIAAAPDRTDLLRALQVPSLVIHGLDDTLVRPSGGLATAKALPNSRLLMFPRMGHDLPSTRTEEICQAIHRLSARG